MLKLAAVPNPNVSSLSFIPPTKTRDADPPYLILTFSVSTAPPTYVTCEVDTTPVDISVLTREVTTTEYIPLDPKSPLPSTNVTVTLRTRQAGDYHCNVSVFRASGNNVTDVKTPLISITGWLTTI